MAGCWSRVVAWGNNSGSSPRWIHCGAAVDASVLAKWGLLLLSLYTADPSHTGVCWLPLRSLRRLCRTTREG